MKIRTITIGFELDPTYYKDQMIRTAHILNKAEKSFQNSGFTVQTKRFSTQPWQEYFTSAEQILDLVEGLDLIAEEMGMDYFSIGPAADKSGLETLYEIFKRTRRCFSSSICCDHGGMKRELLVSSAQLVKKLADAEPGGFANLRYASLFNVGPGSPFFPASYHKGPVSITIGTENSDVLFDSFSQAGSMDEGALILNEKMNRQMKSIQEITEIIAVDENINYGGIDVSIAPSIQENESVAYAFERLGIGKFGGAGTLAVAKMVTGVLHGLDVKKCGYSGLMLPVMEDHGLATRNIEGSFNISNLLLFSAVCGTGLDTIPLPGVASIEKIYALLLDIASLSDKLKKPLSARLMPVPGMHSGEMTPYDFEYFVNTRIMEI